MSFPTTVVFVHGWSVRKTETYGRLPERLVREAAGRGVELDARDVWLSRYVSFRDEVRVEDLSRAFQAAVERDLSDVVASGRGFACITHSTGGPVIRNWWNRYHLQPAGAPPCPMSHLVMLAPANFGSALAQLGKSRLSRVRTWFQGVEPGAGVLDWLELGSPESWDLNRDWITGRKTVVADTGIFPFVLTGQTIDRKLYDHVNPYTGEAGSDGVVRVAAANLNATWVRLEQEPVRVIGDDEKIDPGLVGKPPGSKVAGLAGAPNLVSRTTRYAPETVFKIVPDRSHSGTNLGILRTVEDDDEPDPAVEAVVACLEIDSMAGYEALRKRFADENETVQERERVEIHDRILRKDTVTFTDRHSMVVFRVLDDRGHPIGEFDLKLTATSPAEPNGEPSPDLLPSGFFGDRQRNRRSPATITYYLDADKMNGCPAIPNPEKPDELVRGELLGAPTLGFRIEPHVTEGFVHFLPAEFSARSAMLDRVVQPNQTTLVDIVMRRVVRQGVFQLGAVPERNDRFDFEKTPEGDPITP